MGGQADAEDVAQHLAVLCLPPHLPLAHPQVPPRPRAVPGGCGAGGGEEGPVEEDRARAGGGAADEDAVVRARPVAPPVRPVLRGKSVAGRLDADGAPPDDSDQRTGRLGPECVGPERLGLGPERLGRE